MKKTQKLVAMVAISLSIMGTVTMGATVQAKTAQGNLLVGGAPKEFHNSEELSSVNNGEAPEIHTNEQNDSKLIDGAYTDMKVNNENDAVQSIHSIKDLMKIDYPESELKISKVNKTEDLTSYKLQQVHKDIPVYGRELVVVTDKEGNTTSVAGNYLDDVNVDTNASLSKDQAAESAKANYGGDAKVSTEDLTIFSLNDVKPTLCWKVKVEGTKDGEKYAVNSFIDANNGEKINEVSLLTKSSATGTGKDLTGATRTFNVNKASSWWSGTSYQLYDTVRGIKIYNASNGRIPGTLMSNSKNTWSDATAVSGIVNLEKTYDFYKNNYGRDSYDDNGAQIVASIHYSEGNTGFDNAFWTSDYKQFVFGDGYQYFTPLTGALDVIGHEFTHAVIENTANLEYQGESGALNEGYADIMGNFIEGDNDSQWLIGEDIMKNGGIALRSMSNPESLNQPSKVNGKYYVKTSNPSESNDYGGVHTNSGVINHAVYLMWKNGITDKAKLAKLFYNSLFIMNSRSDFSDCRAAVLSAAKNMNMTSSEINIIKDAFNSVGVTA